MQEHQPQGVVQPSNSPIPTQQQVCFSPIQQQDSRPQTPQTLQQQQPPQQQQQYYQQLGYPPQQQQQQLYMQPQTQQGNFDSRPQTPQSYIPPQQQQPIMYQQTPQQYVQPPQYGIYPQVQPLNTQQFDQTLNQQYIPPQVPYQPSQQQMSYQQQPPQQQQYYQQLGYPPQPQQQPYMHQSSSGNLMQQPPQQPMQPTYVQTTTVTEKTFIPGSTTPTIVQQTVTTTKVPPPIKGSMLQSVKLQVIEHAAKQWYKKRMELIGILQDMITSLDKKQQSSAKTKFGGTVTNIVGASLIVGGVVAAPFTLGGSLLATGAGLTAIAGGTTATVAASVSEWKHAKKTAKIAQEILQADTQAVNDIIAKIYDYRNIDPMVETRTIIIGTAAVNIVTFVNALIGSRVQVLDQTGGVTNDNTGVASLASLLVKGVVPIVSIPVDMVVLVQESKKANGKEPSKLALKIHPVLDSLKIQTRNATGMTIL